MKASEVKSGADRLGMKKISGLRDNKSVIIVMIINIISEAKHWQQKVKYLTYSASHCMMGLVSGLQYFLKVVRSAASGVRTLRE